MSLSSDFRAAASPQLRPRMLSWVGALWTLPIVAFVCSLYTSTFSYGDHLLFLTLGMVPAALVLVTFMRQDSRIWPFASDSPVQPTTRLRVSFLILLMLSVPALILYANQALDPSPARQETSVILEKRESNPRRGGTKYRFYFAGHQGPFARMWPGLLIDRRQSLTTYRSTFRKIEPGGSTVTLRTHRGLFGLPWYEADSVVVSASASR